MPRAQSDQDAIALGGAMEFMRLLWAIDHGLEIASKRMLAQLGVTGPQRLVLRMVGRHPGISAGRLAEILHVHPSTLTGVLGRLVEHGLLVRTTDPADGRRALFSLTAQGRKVDGVRTGTIEARVRAALARMPAREVDATRRVLGAIADSLAAPPRGAAGSASR